MEDDVNRLFAVTWWSVKLRCWAGSEEQVGILQEWRFRLIQYGGDQYHILLTPADLRPHGSPHKGTQEFVFLLISSRFIKLSSKMIVDGYCMSVVLYIRLHTEVFNPRLSPFLCELFKLPVLRVTTFRDSKVTLVFSLIWAVRSAGNSTKSLPVLRLQFSVVTWCPGSYLFKYYIYFKRNLPCLCRQNRVGLRQ